MATLAKMCCTSICIGLWLTVVLLQQPCECRYLPTRSHGDELDKLRELMIQILESSNEEQQRPPNEANGNTLLQQPRSSSWLNKLSPMDAAEGQRKYANLGGVGGGSRGIYEGARYY